jgi:hypothetical protein
MATRLWHGDDDEDVWLFFSDGSCLLIPGNANIFREQTPMTALHWSPSGALVVLEPGSKRVSLVHSCTQSLIGPLKAWQGIRNKYSVKTFVSSSLSDNSGPVTDWDSVNKLLSQMGASK